MHFLWQLYQLVSADTFLQVQMKTCGERIFAWFWGEEPLVNWLSDLMFAKFCNTTAAWWCWWWIGYGGAFLVQWVAPVVEVVECGAKPAAHGAGAATQRRADQQRSLLGKLIDTPVHLV